MYRLIITYNISYTNKDTCIPSQNLRRLKIEKPGKEVNDLWNFVKYPVTKQQDNWEYFTLLLRMPDHSRCRVNFSNLGMPRVSKYHD